MAVVLMLSGKLLALRVVIVVGGVVYLVIVVGGVVYLVIVVGGVKKPPPCLLAARDGARPSNF